MVIAAFLALAFVSGVYGCRRPESGFKYNLWIDTLHGYPTTDREFLHANSDGTIVDLIDDPVVPFDSIVGGFIRVEGTHCEDFGYVTIKMAWQCEEAANALGLKVGTMDGWSSSGAPGGCLYEKDDANVDFNENRGSRTANDDRELICAQSGAFPSLFDYRCFMQLDVSITIFMSGITVLLPSDTITVVNIPLEVPYSAIMRYCIILYRTG